MTEKEIIEKLKNNDSREIKKFVESHQARIINLCYKFLLNREDAEDTAQETFIELFKSIIHFRGESKLSTWLHQIAVSKSLDLIRKKKRQKRMAVIQSIFPRDNQISQIPSPSKLQPEVELEKEERLRILHQAINSLGKNQRIAFTLSKVDGLRNRDVAEIMGLSVSSVESLLFRAKSNLKRELYKYYEKKL